MTRLSRNRAPLPMSGRVAADQREWYRDRPSARRRTRPYHLVVGALAVVVLLFVVARVHAARAPFDPEHQVRHDISFGYGPGLSIELVRAPLYRAHDPWRAYLADEQTCPGGEDADAPLDAQVATMLCLIDFARRTRGLGGLQVIPALSTAARLKGEAIASCRVFAHAPCGGDPHDVAVAAGYVGGWGENLYIADGRFGAPRVALDGWLNSPGHRENVFRAEWRVQSLYVTKPEDFGGFHDATLWVSEFGDR
jgi:hypothetical protein